MHQQCLVLQWMTWVTSIQCASACKSNSRLFGGFMEWQLSNVVRYLFNGVESLGVSTPGLVDYSLGLKQVVNILILQANGSWRIRGRHETRNWVLSKRKRHHLDCINIISILQPYFLRELTSSCRSQQWIITRYPDSWIAPSFSGRFHYFSFKANYVVRDWILT